MIDRQLPPENAPASAEQNGSPAHPLAAENFRSRLADAQEQSSTLEDYFSRVADAVELYRSETRRDVGYVVKPTAVAVDELRRFLIATGEECLRDGKLVKPFDEDEAAGATDRLLAVGDYYLDEDRLDIAQIFYTAAGYEILKD